MIEDRGCEFHRDRGHDLPNRGWIYGSRHLYAMRTLKHLQNRGGLIHEWRLIQPGLAGAIGVRTGYHHHQIQQPSQRQASDVLHRSEVAIALRGRIACMSPIFPSLVLPRLFLLGVRLRAAPAGPEFRVWTARCRLRASTRKEPPVFCHLSRCVVWYDDRSESAP